MTSAPSHDALRRFGARAWFAFVAVVLVGIAGGLWASPEYRDEAEQAGLVGVVENVAVWIALIGGLGAFAATVAWAVRGRWCRAAVSALLVVGSVWVLLVSFSTID
jgi:hypothetical protein